MELRERMAWVTEERKRHQADLREAKARLRESWIKLEEEEDRGAVGEQKNKVLHHDSLNYFTLASYRVVLVNHSHSRGVDVLWKY